MPFEFMPMEVVRFVAVAATMVAAVLVAANYSPRTMCAGFLLFIVASVLWMADGWFSDKPSLVAQNAFLVLVNLVGAAKWFGMAQDPPDGDTV